MTSHTFNMSPGKKYKHQNCLDIIIEVLNIEPNKYRVCYTNPNFNKVLGFETIEIKKEQLKYWKEV